VNRIGLALIGALCVLPFARSYQRGRAARQAARWQGQIPPKEWPSVSIIIPAWHEHGTLEACLASLQRVDYPVFEVIVAAGGPDGTYEKAEQLSREDTGIRVIPQRPEGGKNGAMNDAVRHARGEIVVFLDADGLVSSGWLKALVAALTDGVCGQPYAASTGKFVPIERTLIARAGEMNQLLEYEARGRVSLQGSGSMALRRATWQIIGDLPEGPYADDWDLSARLRYAGLQISHAPMAIVRTERPGDLSEWWTNELRWRRIHLASLLRVARSEMPNATAAVRALYPYLVGWALIALGASALARRLTTQPAWRFENAWLALAAPALARETAGAVEIAAYTGDTRWLSVAPVIPALTLMSWIASAIATVTRHKAPLHFKGPRARRAMYAGGCPEAGLRPEETRASTEISA
jgi:cellulose synthase/poly-beta-1,6-N-acetylglucosamine synthase-like glycosyltransferase